jgi:hypothetical protein
MAIDIQVVIVVVAVVDNCELVAVDILVMVVDY